MITFPVCLSILYSSSNNTFLSSFLSRVDVQFKDFDDPLIEKLFDFYDNKMAASLNPDLAKLLHRELEKKMNERSIKFRTLLTVPPTDILLPDMGKLSVSNFFLALNDNEIARQLTVIGK